MRTDATLDLICELLQQNCGDLYGTARQVGMSVQMITNWMKDDTVAADRIEEAKRVGYMGIESAMIQRGIHGVEEDVYYKGAIAGKKRVYSDSLLGKLAEARIPEYRKGDGAGNNFNAPVQINIMPRATNYDEWLAMKNTTLEARALESLPAPKIDVPEILQGEYVEVEDANILEGLL